MRVIIDTNVVIAGLRSQAGASYEILQRVGRGSFEMALSVPLALEYEEQLKLNTRRIGLTISDIDDILDYWYSVVVPVEVFFLWRPTETDPDDDMLIEAAVAGECDAIISFNTRDLTSAAKFGIRVMTPGAFLRELDQ